MNANTAKPEPAIAILGAGPAGLSIARLLKDHGVRKVTVYEAAPRVGGKSLSLTYKGVVHEMGTCYSTLAHRITNKWMKELGIHQSPLGQQTMDGVPLMEFVRTGSGPSLASEGLRFIDQWRKHQLAVRAHPDHPQVLEECAMSADEWLARHKFIRIRRFMLRAVTNMGYGFLDRTSALQALRWCTPDLIFSGMLAQVKMPAQGWQYFWEQIARDLDVRTADPVRHIERRNDSVVLTTLFGERKFGHVILTAPPDEMRTVLDLSADEAFVADALDWGAYVTTLCEVDGWFRGHEAEAYSVALEPGAEQGQLLSARRVPPAKATRATDNVYLSGQYGAGLSKPELLDRLQSGVAARGGHYRKTIRQERWKYFPRYRREAIQERLVSRMAALQGEGNVWWTGAAFSHEAVSNIVSFNLALTRKMLPALGRR
jgi:predicted NAD/FAD-binding protein